MLKTLARVTAYPLPERKIEKNVELGFIACDVSPQ